jgi:hypothetical protein
MGGLLGDGSEFGLGPVANTPDFEPPFRRFTPGADPDKIVLMAVCPHDNTDVALPREIKRAAERFEFEPQYIWNDPGADAYEDSLLLTEDPWNPEAPEHKPLGWYPDATGSTEYGASCWKKRKGHAFGQLEISWVTWRFVQTVDYSTSVAVKVVPYAFAPAREVAQLLASATKIVQQLEDWLRTIPPSDASVVLRQHWTTRHG